MKVCIDPGHALGSSNGGFGYLEHAGMWKLSNHLKAALERCKIEAVLTRTENTDPSLVTRGYSSRGCDMFISEHSNAANGTARGVEVYYSVQIPGDKKIAAAIAEAEAAVMNSTDRGAKTRESTEVKCCDYYSVMYAAREMRCPHVLLIENGFHDNASDVGFLKDDDMLWLLAQVQCQEICRFLGVDYISSRNVSDDVISAPSATLRQTEAWARSKGATEVFVSLAKLYFEMASVLGGVNPVIAFAQAALETGYGKFNGVLDESCHNPCGMKSKDGGDDYDKNAHHRFSTWDDGVRAHLDHLALYAGAEGYPRAFTHDPRHFSFLAGMGKTIAAMSKGWCPSNAGYADTIRRMIREIETMTVQKSNISICGNMYDLPMTNINGTNYAAVKELANIMPDLNVSVRQVFDGAGYKVEWDDASKMIIINK